MGRRAAKARSGAEEACRDARGNRRLPRWREEKAKARSERRSAEAEEEGCADNGA